MPDAFVVGPTGLPRYSYPDWRAAGVQRWRVAYGDAADTSPETPDGLIIDTITLESHQVGEGVQSCYGNSFVRTAEGVNLDLLLDQFGRQRLAAEPSVVEAVWWGDANTVVWNGVGVGPVASVDTAGTGNGDRYTVVTAGTLPVVDDEGAVVVYEVIRGVDGDDYVIDFDGTPTPITATSDVPLEIAELMAAAIVADYPTFTASAWAVGTGAIVVIDGKAGEDVTVAAASSDPGNAAVWPAVRLTMEAEDTGPQQVLAGTLTAISTPAAGLEGVVNTEDGDLGRDRETDSELRARHFDQVNVGGRGTPARIRAALLDQDPEDRAALDLEAVRVFNNTSGVEASIDGRTVPAHAFEVVLLGDATTADIAAVIFDQTPAGIQSYGEIETLVIDAAGGSNPVRFTRATELYLHLEIDVTASEGFPSGGDPAGAIEAAIVADLTIRMTLGQNFHRVSALAVAIVTIPGISSGVVLADATAAPGDVPALAGADVVVAADEILRVSSTRITVNIV